MIRKERASHEHVATRFLITVVLFTVMLAFIVSAAALYFNFDADLKDAERSLVVAEKNELPSLGFALWNFDFDQINLTLQGILRLPFVERVEISKPDGTVIAAQGMVSSIRVFERNYPITFDELNQSHTLGNLHLVVGREHAYARLGSSLVAIGVSELLKAFVLALFISYVFQKMIGRPLVDLASDLQTVGLAQESGRIRTTGNLASIKKTREKLLSRLRRSTDKDLHSGAPEHARGDEFDIIEQAISSLAQSLEGTAVDLNSELQRRQELEQQARFLSDVSLRLSNCLDSVLATNIFASCCVPGFAEWIVIDLQVPPDVWERRVAMHANRNLEPALLQELPLNTAQIEFADGQSLNLQTLLQADHPQFINAAPGQVLFKKRPGAHESLTSSASLEVTQICVAPLMARSHRHGLVWFNLKPHETSSLALANRAEFVEQLVLRLAMTLERASLYEKTQASNFAKDNLLQMVSHELRTPLNSILGFGNLLLDATEKPKDGMQETHESAAAIVRNANQLMRLVDNLIDASDYRNARLHLNASIIDLAGLLRRVCRQVQENSSHATGNLIQINLDIAAKPILVLGDQERLKEVFVNLVSNALKFSPASGNVRIVLEQVGKYAEVTIQDHGKGIAPDYLSHLFERFSQADSTLTRKHGGIGLGLSLAYDILILHGGQLTAQSAGEGKGSTFTARLPLFG